MSDDTYPRVPTIDDDELLNIEAARDHEAGLAPVAFREETHKSVGTVVIPSDASDLLDEYNNSAPEPVSFSTLAKEFKRLKDHPQEYITKLEMKRKLDLSDQIIPSDAPSLIWRNTYYIDALCIQGKAGRGLLPIIPDDTTQFHLYFDTELKSAGAPCSDRYAHFDYDINGLTYKVGRYRDMNVHIVFKPNMLDVQVGTEQHYPGSHTALPILYRHQFAVFWAHCLSDASQGSVYCTDKDVVVNDIDDVKRVSNIL